MKTDLELARLFTSGLDWDTIGADTQYEILELYDETVIIFAESNSLTDWMINLDFPKTAYKRMETTFYAHRGFLKEWKLIEDFFVGFIEDKFERGEDVKPITIVGWSYGGAMATLLKESLWFSFPMLRKTTKMITFGSPRSVGFLKFNGVRERWNNCTLYRNGFDLVPSIPFLFMGFRHVRKNTQIGEKRCITKIFKTGKYHEITSYIESLEVLDTNVKK